MEVFYLQCAQERTHLILLDEVSMIGRQMMGKIDHRLTQGREHVNEHHASMGGASCALVGDPAQIPPIRDDPFYDSTPHKDTKS